MATEVITAPASQLGGSIAVQSNSVSSESIALPAGNHIQSTLSASSAARVPVSEPQNVAVSRQTSGRRRFAIALFVLMANLVQMISTSSTIAAGVKLAEALGVNDIRKAAWVAASYPLTQGTFVMISGRLGSIYGHRNMLLLGGAWFTAWSLINVGCRTFLSFNLARGLAGMGGGFILPNAVAMIGVTFPPGKMRNFCYGIFGGSGPIGGALGAVLAGIFVELTPWWYLFVFKGLLGGCVFLALWKILPPEIPADRQGKMDWIGAALSTAGLILFNFAWNQAPSIGWNDPYVIGTLVSSIAFLAAFAGWEYRCPRAIMPLSVWKAASFPHVIIAFLLSSMSFGICVWYTTAWLQLIRGWSVLDFGAAYMPNLVFGVFAAWLGSWLVPRVSAQYILGMGIVAMVAASLLVTTMPIQQSYWPQVFPAISLMSLCPDLVFTASQIIASNAVPRSQQGAAASLIGTLLLYGNSLGLGFAGTIEQHISQEESTIEGYRAALWFAFAIAMTALLLTVGWVRMTKDDREAEGDEYFEHDDVSMAVGTGVELERVRQREVAS